MKMLIKLAILGYIVCKVVPMMKEKHEKKKLSLFERLMDY